MGSRAQGQTEAMEWVTSAHHAEVLRVVEVGRQSESEQQADDHERDVVLAGAHERAAGREHQVELEQDDDEVELVVAEDEVVPEQRARPGPSVAEPIIVKSQ